MCRWCVRSEIADSLTAGGFFGRGSDGKLNGMICLTIPKSDPHAVDLAKCSAIKVSETWVAGERKFG